MGKDLIKSPSQVSERAINVIQDYVAALRFPLPPRAIIETEANRHSAAQMPFFVLRRRLRKRAFDTLPYHKKSHNQRLLHYKRQKKECSKLNNRGNRKVLK